MRFKKIVSIISLALLLSVSCKAMDTVHTAHFYEDKQMVECKIWDIETGRKLRSLEIPSDTPLEVAVSGDCTKMAILRNSQTIEVCAIEQDSYRKLRVIPGLYDLDCRLKLGHDSENYILYCSKGTSDDISTWSSSYFRRRGEPEEGDLVAYYCSDTRDVALSHNCTMMARAEEVGQIKLSPNDFPSRGISLENGRNIDVQAYSLAFNHDSTQIAFSTDDKKIKILDLQTDPAQEIKTFDVICSEEIEPKILAFNRDSTILAVQVGQIVNFYNTETGEIAYVSSEFETEDENERTEFLRNEIVNSQEENGKKVIIQAEDTTTFAIPKSLLCCQ